MTKGTTSFGLRGKHTHTTCNRCNHRAYHIQHKRCGSCGYPDAKMRRFNWSIKAKRRRTVGTGRCRYLTGAIRRARNGHRDGKVPKARKTN